MNDIQKQSFLLQFQSRVGRLVPHNFDADALEQLENLLDSVAASDVNDPRLVESWNRIAYATADLINLKPGTYQVSSITKADLSEALRSLCPIWPFC